MRFKSLIIVISLCVTSHAHVDKIITVEDNKLIGLPEEFQPAELDLEAKRLRINNHEMILPDYLNSLLTEEPNELKITASWYHTASKLPPYLGFNIKPIDKDYDYRILLDLNSLEIVYFCINIQIDEERSRWFEVDLDEDMKKRFRASIREITEK
jgi:hypothetical protein